MKISIIIPAYNEEITIGELVSKVQMVDFEKNEKEIIVVDDGSYDKSYENASKLKNIILLKHKQNQGKGAAVKTGIKRASGDIILIQDADLELDPQDIPLLIKPLIEGESLAVYGSRLIGKKNPKHNFLYYFGGKFITFITDLLYGIKLTDEPCGYKAFKADLIKKIKINDNGFGFEPEITAKIARMKIKIKEVPVSYYPRNRMQGKKLNILDGMRAVWTLFKYRFVY